MSEPIVLMVDDEAHWIDFARNVLATKGFSTIHFRTLEEAQSFLASSYHVDFLLINSDLVVGWDDLQQAFCSDRLGHVMILASSPSVSQAVEAFRRGMDYDHKPFGEDGVLMLADHLLASTSSGRRNLQPTSDADEGSIHALVVEDKAEWQCVFSSVLSNMLQTKVTVVGSYAGAVGALASGAINIVVADIRLMDEDSSNIEGLVLLKGLYETKANVAVIVTSGFLTIELARQAMLRYNALDVFLKNPDSGAFELARFRDAVRRAVQQVAPAQYS